MFKNADASNVSRRHFLTVAGGVAAAGSLVSGKESALALVPSDPMTSVHYLVTIDVRSGSISYAVSPPIDPHNMHVHTVDEIKWQVKSAGPNPQHKAAILFIATTPFADPTGHPTHTFQWSEQDDATGGFGGGQAQLHGSHEYCVAVFD